MSLRIELRRLPHGEGLPLPATASPGAAGLDLSAALAGDAPLTIPAGGRALVPTGFALALPEGTEAQVRPRSGLALRHGVTVLNAPGTIDSDYRGEIQVLLVNLGEDPFRVSRGLRIAQLVVARVEVINWAEVEVLSETGRGAAGFGSTGGTLSEDDR
jgi:dUTP pyrophosphatase